MYRNYRVGRYTMNSCKCNENKEDVLEDACNDVVQYVPCPDEKECDCGFDEDEGLFPNNPMFGQSYVPKQILNTTFTPAVGLKMGTIFPELVSPYMPGQSMEEIEFLKKTNPIKEGCNRA